MSSIIQLKSSRSSSPTHHSEHKTTKKVNRVKSNQFGSGSGSGLVTFSSPFLLYNWSIGRKNRQWLPARIANKANTIVQSKIKPPPTPQSKLLYFYQDQCFWWMEPKNFKHASNLPFPLPPLKNVPLLKNCSKSVANSYKMMVAESLITPPQSTRLKNTFQDVDDDSDANISYQESINESSNEYFSSSCSVDGFVKSNSLSTDSVKKTKKRKYKRRSSKKGRKSVESSKSTQFYSSTNSKPYIYFGGNSHDSQKNNPTPQYLNGSAPSPILHEFSQHNQSSQHTQHSQNNYTNSMDISDNIPFEGTPIENPQMNSRVAPPGEPLDLYSAISTPPLSEKEIEVLDIADEIIFLMSKTPVPSRKIVQYIRQLYNDNDITLSVLEHTKLGFVINTIRLTSLPGEIANEATLLVNKWRSLVQKSL